MRPLLGFGLQRRAKAPTVSLTLERSGKCGVLPTFHLGHSAVCNRALLTDKRQPMKVISV
jgi:hypothetical protein